MLSFARAIFRSGIPDLERDLRDSAFIESKAREREEGTAKTTAELCPLGWDEPAAWPGRQLPVERPDIIF